MRTLFFLILFAFGFQAMAQDATTEKKEKPGKKIVTMKVLISGMTCAHGCAAGIQDHVYQLKGVKSSTVDFETMTGTFVFDESKISKQQILDAIVKFNPGEVTTPKYKAEEIIADNK